MSTAIPIFRLSLSNILAGLALTKSFDTVVRSDASRDDLLLCAFFTLNVVNFFHAKIAVAEENRFRALVENHPGAALLETHMTSLLWLSFYVQAFFIKDVELFLVGIAAIRITDIILVGLDTYIDACILKSGASPHILHRLYWVVYDALYLAFVGIYFFGDAIMSLTLHFWLRGAAPEILLASVVLDYALDYSLGKALYGSVRPVPPVGHVDAGL